MGGLGSGTWCRRRRKQTCDDSLSVKVGDFRGQIFPDASGSLRLVSMVEVGFRIIWNPDPVVYLNYFVGSFEVSLPVLLQTTPAQFGGQRWWFTCPLMVDGEGCNRRVGKLYLPRGSKCFGCRQCFDLSYKSCQQSHRDERFLAGIEKLDDWLKSIKTRRFRL